jgi:uncharacterized membrane protein YfcA
MDLSDLLSFGSGGLVGFALGLLGGGGSILAVPLLMYVVGIKDAHVAIGTSALAVSANAFGSAAASHRAGHHAGQWHGHDQCHRLVARVRRRLWTFDGSHI